MRRRPYGYLVFRFGALALWTVETQWVVGRAFCVYPLYCTGFCLILFLRSSGIVVALLSPLSRIPSYLVNTSDSLLISYSIHANLPASSFV